jgi:uncharacterized protein
MFTKDRNIMNTRKKTAEVIESLRRLLPDLKPRYHVESLSVFGSFIRNEHNPDSDLDVLVTFTETPSLLKFIELENHLSDVLGIKIDLVMKDSLKPRIGRQILSEAVMI